jgi:ubiquinone/menaquinone biosynthesis C-methylase UbiE
MSSPHRSVWSWSVGAALVVALTLTSVVSPIDRAGREARRDRHLQPDRVLDAVGLGPGMTVGEVGAGRGYFTLKLARRVGAGGRVWANDIDGDALDELRRRCAGASLANVTTVIGQIDDPQLPRAALDMVFIVYALHDFEKPVAVLRHLGPSLKPGATVVVLDQDPEVTGSDHFLPSSRIAELFAEAGYEPVAVHGFLERDLLLVFRLGEKPAGDR